ELEFKVLDCLGYEPAADFDLIFHRRSSGMTIAYPTAARKPCATLTQPCLVDKLKQTSRRTHPVHSRRVEFAFDVDDRQHRHRVQILCLGPGDQLATHRLVSAGLCLYAAGNRRLRLLTVRPGWLFGRGSGRNGSADATDQV